MEFNEKLQNLSKKILRKDVFLQYLVVELTGLAPVYQRKPTKLSPYTVYFCRHTTKKANKLAVSRHLELR